MTRVDFRGTPATLLERAGGARAVVALHGAQLLSWRPAGGREWIFLSERAALAPGKAIRGGVPICFPQFAALGPLPKHGFVRTRTWRSAGKRIVDGDPIVTLSLEPDAELRAQWPHPFHLELAVRLGEDRIRLELTVFNAGDQPLQFTAALHGYFAVGDVEAVTITGLGGLAYRDSAAGDRPGIEGADAVRIRGEVDRVYHAVPGEVVLREPDRALALRAEGFPDVVVWNPGPAKCASLPDMEPDGWRRMLCVEAGAIRAPVVVAPRETWRGRQVLTALEATGR
ncbi:MAG TPA: D-hexose-6-phosphate mutarotase [Anaeromyxobacteraceae bacterium]|nr:D-hexose-6-phosphate mutarotase [Anaeromyxobacteraceae bacterium]